MDLAGILIIIISTLGLLLIPIVIEGKIKRRTEKLMDDDKKYNDFRNALDKSHIAQKEYDELQIINAIYEKVCNGVPEITFIRDNISERLREAARWISFWKRNSIEYTIELNKMPDNIIQDNIDNDFKEFVINQKQIMDSIIVTKKKILNLESWKKKILILSIALNIVGLTLNSYSDKKNGELQKKYHQEIMEQLINKRP